VAQGLDLFEWPEFPPGPAFNGLIFLPALYIAILIHELGHLVAGKVAGMITGGVCIGGLVIAKSGEHWVVRFQPRFLFGGFAMSLPVPGELRRSRFAWMVAGGPIASVLMAGVCWAAIAQYGDEGLFGDGEWIGTLFWSAVITIASSVIPYSVRGIMSDGRRLWQLFRDPAATRRVLNLRALHAEEVRGVRPRDWDAALVEAALETPTSESSYPYLQLLAYYRRVDLDDEQGALVHLENALAAPQASGSPVTRACYLEAACASADTRRNPAQARRWMERAAQVKRGKPEQLHGIEATIAMAEGRYGDALQHWAQYRDYIKRKRLDSGLARFAKERTAVEEERCRAAMAEASAAQGG
jgi:hypothetical protein